MSEIVKDSEKQASDSVTSLKQPPSTPPEHPRHTFLLAFLAFVSSLAILALGLFLYFGNTPGQPAGKPAPTRSVVASAEELNPTPAPGGFAIAAEPAPGPSPTPSGTPNEATRLLALGDDYLEQGRPVDAAAQYRLVLDSFPRGPDAKPALYGLARSSMQRGRYAEAADAFKKYLAAYPDDSLKRQCYYYLGQASKEQGYWEEAISYYQKYQAEIPGKLPLDGYAWFEIGDVYINLLKPLPAIEAYKKAGESPNASNLLRVTALEKVGDYYARENNPAEAINWYAKILELARVPDYRAGIISKQALAFEAARLSDKATELNRQLINEYLGTPAGFATLKTLFNANSPLLDDYYRGYYSWRTGDTAAALTTLNRLLGRPDDKAPPPPPSPDLSKQAQERLARAWFWLAGIYETKGDAARASTEYRELLARYPQTVVAPEALWKLARLVEKAGNVDEALRLYAQLVDRYPADQSAEEAMYAQVRLTLTKDPELAQPLVETLAQKYPLSNRRAQSFYELGRAYQARSNQAQARAALQKAAIAPQADYFTVRASERLVDAYDPNTPPRSNPATHPAVYSPATFAQIIERDRATFETWLPSWAAPAQTAPAATAVPASQAELDTARQRIRDDAGIKRMLELLSVGRNGQATREAKETYDRYADKPLELYALSLTLSEHRQYYYSITAARRILALYQQKNSSAGLLTVPPLLQKLIYPLPFQSIILEQSRRHDFDPLLMVSLMKQESAFDPDATSSVGARGLTQVMPDTGRGIAANLDKPGFKTDDLYRPYTAIEFGAYYLATRLKDFDGNPYEALAAYNGGAGNVYRWSKAVPSALNFDGWVDNIDFPETRGYVQVIYASYYLYRKIYAGT